MNTPSDSSRDTDIPADWDRSGLPAWCYRSQALLELERTVLFRTHWQLICHVADIPNAGDYMAVDVCGERALVVRDSDGQIRAFHNMCRHRGSRLAPDGTGHCNQSLICPFHGWSYRLDGRLHGVVNPASFPVLKAGQFDLKTVEYEIWSGFVFVRFAPGPQPSVASLMTPFEEELEPYALSTLVPTGPIWQDQSAVNWKTVRDVDNEGYHVPRAHPTLMELYGSTYVDEPYINGVSRSFAVCAQSVPGTSCQCMDLLRSVSKLRDCGNSRECSVLSGVSLSANEDASAWCDLPIQR